jgi:orotidine-5'-phosphate decarboxylase
MDKLIVALDVGTFKEAEVLVKTLSPAVRIFKIGKELFTASGPASIEMVHRHNARVFLDLKFHDIPNTVAGACQSAMRHGVFMLNVHALGGQTMMIKAVQALNQLAEQEPSLTIPLIVGVTVLTSLTDQDLKEIGLKGKVKNSVVQLAILALQCGLNGVVASPQETALIRKKVGKNFLIVTPGVRPVWAASGDQKRVLTPKQAIKEGADYIVVGRPITQDPHPLEAAQKILTEIQS